MNKEIKAAKKFAKASLKGNINFEAVSSYINQIGYTINFYNQSETDNLIEKYKLSDFSKSVHGFTIKAKNVKTVFIDISLSAENKLRTLLHETGHIVLGHMDRSSTISDKRLQDMQAEAFAYAVLTYKNDYKLLYTALCLILISALSITIGYSSRSDTETHTLPTVITPQAVTTTEAPVPIAETVEELMYVTKTGTRYHKADCRYVRNNKTSKAITAEEAKTDYTPCKVCNP